MKTNELRKIAEKLDIEKAIQLIHGENKDGKYKFSKKNIDPYY